MRRRLIPLAILAVLAVALVIGEALSGKSSPTGRAAPALPTHSLQGAPVTIASLHGRPAIVHFWASWCGPCTKEAPELARLSGELKGRATLVGVDWSDDSGNARKFLARHHWTFASLSDPNGASGNAYGISGLPTTFILDSNGRILKRLTGPQTAAGLLAEVERA